MTGTTMAAFKAAMVAQTRTNLSAAAIRAAVGYGEDVEAPSPYIWIGAALATDGLTGPAGFRGGKPRIDEEYRVEVFIDVLGLPSAQASEARAVVVAAAVEDAVYAEPVQGLDGVTGAWVAGRDLDTYPTANGLLSRLKITVLVKARTL